jgi:hypothetical protein
MVDEIEYHQNKRPGKTYVSKSVAFSSQSARRFRIASKVIDSTETHAFALEKGEHVIRTTAEGRQEIVAKFYEDNRGVFGLTIQRFTGPTGAPHRTHFSFVGDEIGKLLEFISNLQLVQFPSSGGLNVTDGDLKRMILTRDQALRLVTQNQELVLELARSEVTRSDIVALGYRRKQLERFDQLLHDADYFDKERRESGLSEEAIWQAFFEQNKWIFGYGLSYVFVAGLDERKLEQMLVGADLGSPGKRADAVLKTRGIIEALCFVEIKKPTAPLLQSKPYRAGCWAPSDDLAGGISQLQGTVALATRRLAKKLELTDFRGDLTGETVFTYQPRSFLTSRRSPQARCFQERDDPMACPRSSTSIATSSHA